MRNVLVRAARRAALLLLVATSVTAAVGVAASAASGDLDAGFGGADHGRVVVGGVRSLYGVAVQSNGAVVGVGRADGKAGVIRLRPDGSRDTRFGTRKLTGAGGTRADGYAVAIQGNGRILVAGQAADASDRTDMGVWRLLQSGAVDPSFGTDGFASFGEVNVDEYASAVALDAQGRVVLAGATSNGDDMLVVRFTSAGMPDKSFNSVAATGVPYFQISGTGYDWAGGVAVQPGNGKIVITGRYDDATGAPVFRIIPGDPAGTGTAVLDAGFGGGDGLAEVAGLDPYPEAVDLLPDGRIVVAGATAATARAPGRPTAVRLTSAGVVDPTYGSDTGVHIRIPGATDGYLTAVRGRPGSGGVAVTGTTVVDGKTRWFVAKLNARGAVDKDMGPGGARLLNPRDTDVTGVAVQPDGRILAVGTTRIGATSTRGVVYRLLGDRKKSPCAGMKATIIGTKVPDKLVGTPRPDVIAGLGGGDTIVGLGSGDVICGGAGNDHIRGGPGNDSLYGQAGHDTLIGGRGRDKLKQ